MSDPKSHSPSRGIKSLEKYANLTFFAADTSSQNSLEEKLVL